MANAEKRKRSRDCRVALGANLVIGNASELHAQLGQALDKSVPVVLDAAAVSRLDTSALQLLQAFAQARNEGARAWRWENVGDGLREAATLLGLQKMLELPDAKPANH